MPTAVRETVLAAFFARLQTMTGVTVKRTPDFDFKADELPAVAQFTGGHVIPSQASGIALRTVRVRVGCGVVAASPADLEGAINDLHAKVIVALMADPTLGGSIVGMIREVEMTDPDFDDQAGKPNSQFTLAFELDVSTDELSPYTAAPL